MANNNVDDAHRRIPVLRTEERLELSAAWVNKPQFQPKLLRKPPRIGEQAIFTSLNGRRSRDDCQHGLLRKQRLGTATLLSIMVSNLSLLLHLYHVWGTTLVMGLSWIQPLRRRVGSTRAVPSSMQIATASTSSSASIDNGDRSIPFTMIDPLLARILQEAPSSSSELSSTPTNSTLNDFAAIPFGSVREISHGLSVWRTILLRGRLPIPSDFVTTSSSISSSTLVSSRMDVDSFEADRADTTTNLVWPPEPLFDKLVQGLGSSSSSSSSSLSASLPRLVQRHPSILSTVLRAILRMALEFSRQRDGANKVKQTQSQVDDEYDDDFMSYESIDESEISLFEHESDPLSPEASVELADELVGQMMQDFGGLISGLSALDYMFGTDSGTARNTNGAKTATVHGIGVNDGLWQHSGWKQIPALQRQLAALPALRTLLQQLGRRSTATSQSARLDKFAPRKVDVQGGMGAERNDWARESVSGLTHSNSLTDMLPSEAMLLLQQKQQRGSMANNTANANSISSSSINNSTSALRRLFWAKRVESKLLSYQLSGWTDVASLPLPRHRRKRRTPSAPGGPIILCLDTSDSMSGVKLFLSKAVVVAAVKAAHSQGRTCRVVAFGTERSVLDAGPMTADRMGMTRLLDFLAHSFVGSGTDVTGALRYAMSLLSSNNPAAIATAREGELDFEDMTGADLLLITDGEIPAPSMDLVQQLEQLEQRSGVQIHGLLVGQSDADGLQARMKALGRLCTHTHDFLTGSPFSKGGVKTAERIRFVDGRSSPRRRDMTLSAGKGDSYNKSWSRTCLGKHQKIDWSSHVSKRSPRLPWAIFARKFDDDEEEDMSFVGGRRQQQFSVDQDRDNVSVKRSSRATGKISSNSMLSNELTPDTDAFQGQVETTLERIQDDVGAEIEQNMWKVEALESEKRAHGSCWCFRDQLRRAIELVSENLVEREEESRLVVLGMAASEHVLLLGPPGTGKSELGRRLSKLCGGSFFQRLLTRFTTPEEIFGPLSLRALENDEYKRCTDGFLPKASVAFLDEIFKANSAILNTLLTILNERQFDNGAGLRENCPIRCVIAASNELPESDELEALYDRFLLRKEVAPVSDEGVVQLLSLTKPGASTCDETPECDLIFADSVDKVVEALSRAADAVQLSPDICFLLRDLRSFVREELDMDISDRRLVKAARLLKISAASHGRARVDLIDCLLLQHVAWNLPEHRPAIKDWLWDNLTPGTAVADGGTSATVASQLNVLVNGLRQEALTLVRKTSGDVSGATGARPLDVAAIAAICTEASALASILQQELDKLSRHEELLCQSTEHLWLDPEDAQAAQQLLIPKAKTAQSATKRVLARARLLQAALVPVDSPLAPQQNAVSNEIRLSVMEQLWDDATSDSDTLAAFTMDELGMTMREAKAKYDGETFRRWKRERKKAGL